MNSHEKTTGRDVIMHVPKTSGELMNSHANDDRGHIITGSMQQLRDLEVVQSRIKARPVKTSKGRWKNFSVV